MSVQPLEIRLFSQTQAKIVATPQELWRGIDTLLSYPVKGAQFSPLTKKKRVWVESTKEWVVTQKWDGRKHCFSSRTGIFPLQLLPKVTDYLESVDIEYKIVDLREAYPIPTPTPSFIASINENYVDGVTLYEHQLRTLKACLPYQSGIIHIATGGGKTLIAAALIQALGQLAELQNTEYNVLFLVGGRGNQLQARDDLARYLGWAPEEIGLVGDKYFEFRTVTVAIVDSMLSEDPVKKAVIREQQKKTTLLIGDEIHHSKSKTWYEVVEAIQAPYRFGLSGTPFTGDGDLLVEAAFGPVRIYVSNEELMRVGVTASIEIEMVPVRGPETTLTGKEYKALYRECIVENEERNELIVQKIAQRVTENRPTLVIVEMLEHGDRIAQKLAERAIPFEFVFGKGTKTEEIDRKAHLFESGKVPVLISSPLFDEARDIKAARAFILASGHKSLRATLQRIGRGLRKKKGENKLYMTDYLDLMHPIMGQHSLDRLTIYEKEKFKVK